MSIQEKFDCWAIVELFGHAKIAGKCTEQNVAGTNMLRVDVPDTPQQPAFTRLLGSAAIYAINPVDEETARYMAASFQVKPIDAWNVSAVMEKYKQRLALHAVGDQEREYNPNQDDPGQEDGEF